MLNGLLNLGVIAAYLALIRIAWSYRSRVRRGKMKNPIDGRRLAALCIAAFLIFLKTWQLGDAILFTGQLGLVLVVGLYGYERFRLKRRARHGKRIEVLGDGATVSPLIEEAGLPPEEVLSKRRPLNVRRWLKVMAILLVSLGLGAYLLHITSTPNQGTVNQSASGAAATVAPKQLTLNAKNFSLEYPDTFTAAKTDPPHPPTIESFDLLKHQTGVSWELAVQVESPDNGSLTNDGSYRLRQVHPERYSETNASVNGEQVHIMNDNAAESGFSRSAFFVSKGRVGIVTLTASGGEEAEQLYNSLLQSWHWK